MLMYISFSSHYVHSHPGWNTVSSGPDSLRLCRWRDTIMNTHTITELDSALILLLLTIVAVQEMGVQWACHMYTKWHGTELVTVWKISCMQFISVCYLISVDLSTCLIPCEFFQFFWYTMLPSHDEALINSQYSHSCQELKKSFMRSFCVSRTQIQQNITW